MSNTDLIRHLRAEHAKHFDALGDLLFDAARALEAAEADRTYRLRTSSRTMTVVVENEVFVTLLDGGRPAFWEIREGRPVMLSCAVTAAGREPKPEEQGA